MIVFLALLIAHLIGDFVLQRQTVIAGKRAGRWSAFAEHGTVHLLCLIVVWVLFSPLPLGMTAVWLAFLAIILTHLVVDWLKYRLAGAHQVAAFVLDQLVHIVILLVVAWWLLGRPDWAGAVASYWHQSADQVALLVTAYLVVVVACGWLNRLLLDTVLPPDSADSNDRDGLAQAGLRIGWLERFLMFSAFLVEAWAALGLVLAAKSVFRFESIRADRAHAEYFVIGTLLSVAQVVAVGMVYLFVHAVLTGGM